MRPGVPWSVKGIDDQARVAAKSAARQAGLTLGEWLNTIILETADDQPARPQPAPNKQQKKTAGKTARTQSAVKPKSARPSDNEIKDRLDKLADQLSNLTQQSQDTAVSRFLKPAGPAGTDAGSLESIIDRIESNERHSETAFETVNQRLHDLSEKLVQNPTGAFPERPEDVPGFSALESALRNIVDHIGASDKRTVDTLTVIQDRMAEIAERATLAQDAGINSNAPAIVSLEQRVAELANRMDQTQHDPSQNLQSYVDTHIDQLSQRIDAVHHSTDAITEKAQSVAAQSAQDQGREFENRLTGIVEELQSSMSAAPDLSRLHGEIESLNQRYDDIKADSASESDVQALRTSIEQLTGKIGDGPDLSPLSEMEQRLSDLTSRLEQSPAMDGVSPQMDELERRVEDLDAKLRETIEARPAGSVNDALVDQIASVNDRLSATEQKLGHLATIEKSITLLFESVEQNRELAKEAAEAAIGQIAQQTPGAGEEASAFAPSGELQALKEGLDVVKASAESADQRNQETLEAVHDTLEQIINKLTDLEQHAAAAPQIASATENPFETPLDEQIGGAPGAEISEAVADHQPDDSPFGTPFEPAPEPIDAAAPPVPPEPGSDPDFVAAPQDNFGEQPDLQTEVAPPIEEPQSAPAPEMEREDFIAAARRAAQSAAPQNRSSMLAGLNLMPQRGEDDHVLPGSSAPKASSKFSLPFFRRKKTVSEDVVTNAINGAAGEDAESRTNGKRRQLILAGLVLLAAVSAYSFGGVSKKLFSPKPASVETSAVEQPAMLSQILPLSSGSAPTMPETVPLGSAAANQSVSSSPPTTLPLAALTNPQEAKSPDQAILETALDNHNMSTASLTPTAPQAAKFDQESDTVLQVTSVSAAPLLTEASSGNASAANTISPVSVAQTGASPKSDLLPQEIGSSSLRQAAADGNPNAQFVVASRYLDGKLVTQDFKLAAEWYRKAAAQGLAPAQYRLGTMFERGRGLPKDLTAARLWYERAAERKNVKSMHNLAVIYSNNQDGKGDFGKAAKWFQAAAEHGLRDSLYNIAVLYERGLGVTQDLQQAYFWFGVAARHNDADAKAKIAGVRSKLSESNRVKLDQQITKWVPKKPDSAGNLVAVSDPKWQVAGAASATKTLAPSTEPVQADGGNLVGKAQELLSDMGYDVGPMDGVMGSRTANAVRLFQLQTGLPVNGMVSAELIQLLQARRI